MSSKLFLRISIVLILLLFVFMLKGPIYFLFITPFTGFDPSRSPPEPDYTLDGSWAELPKNRNSLKTQAFYIHPTSLRSALSWNAEAGSEEAKERFQWTRTWQLPIFNSCCDVYAPFYREATLASFWRVEPGRQARQLAYEDVLKAFDHFIAQRWNKEGFILGGHSQGADIGYRLIHDRIAGTPLQNKLIVAVLPGFPVPKKASQVTLKSVYKCQTKDDVGCFLTWNTLSKDRPKSSSFDKGEWYLGEQGYKYTFEEEFHCNNPASWSIDNTEEPSKKEPFLGPGTNITFSECSDKGLLINDLGDAVDDFMGGNYHLYDIGLFMNQLQDNLHARSKAWRAKHKN